MRHTRPEFCGGRNCLGQSSTAYGCQRRWYQPADLSMEEIFGSGGFEIFNGVLSDRSDRWLRMKPEGKWSLEAICRIFLNRTTPAEKELWRASLRNLASVSVVKSAHLALRMFVYVRYGSVGRSGNPTSGGRGGELAENVAIVDYSFT